MPFVTKVWVDDTQVHIQTEDGEIYSQNFSDYFRLRYATPKQRANFTTSPFGIHWEDVDEDLSFSGFIAKNSENQSEIYRIFKAHPEINVASIARRMGIDQSLMAHYIGGTKKPSVERKKQIEKALHEIGASLAAVKFT
ncbi:MAG: DUF2442 domain-containing protein [Prevotellaceae bacterium]|jgi:hypothetical protein|nr:DUF2442 domain-containing protein [Prevotellaceae bacterium]